MAVPEETGHVDVPMAEVTSVNRLLSVVPHAIKIGSERHQSAFI